MSSDLFAAAGAQIAAAGTTTARTQQLKAAELVQARQLAVTKGLQSLETALSGMRFESSNIAGDREEIREDRARVAEREVYRTEDVVTREPIMATREQTELRQLIGQRNVMAQRPVFETRDIVETRDVFETRDVTETRDIVETQPVYTQQEIRQTLVAGTRDISGFNRISNAGIDSGADFSITVGNGSTAVIRFTSSTRIRLTVDGDSTNFNFTSNNGSWRTALVSALNTLDNLSASIDGGGQLLLETANAETLQIADVANSVGDISGSPLDDIGLTAGTTSSSVIGHQQVQTGTEDVVVGTEVVVIGTEEVLVGTEDVVVGTEDVEVGIEDFVARVETVVIGEQLVVTGTETYVAGTRDVVTGTREIFDRTEFVDSGVTDNVLIGFTRAVGASAPEATTQGSRRPLLEAVLTLDSAIGRASAANPFSDLSVTLGLDKLAGISTTADRDAALAKVRAALEAFEKSTAATSLATLIQANIALGKGDKASPLAYATAATSPSTLKVFA